MEGNRRVIPYYDLREEVGRDTIRGLMQNEVHFVAATHSKRVAYKRFRKTAVMFMETQSRSLDFDALIPYMAMTYVDRILLDGEIPIVVNPPDPQRNAILFLICCLTIAWKLRTKNFELPSFLQEKQLNYSTQAVLDMELHICRYLDWRIRTLTPFCFVEFFVPFLDLPPDSPSPLPSVRQLIVKSQFDVAFTEFRPSVLATAAMLTVYSKMFPGQYGVFATYVMTSEFISPHMDDVYKCKDLLMPLYKEPSVPAEPKATRGESSSSVVKRSDPIPIPGKGTPTAAPIKKKPMSIRLFLASLNPELDVDEELRRYQKEKQAWEEKERIRLAAEGKQHAASDETDPETEGSHELVEDDPDELMDFELGWIEAQAEADRKGEVPAQRDAGSGTQADTRGVVPAGTGSDTQADTRGDIPAGGHAGSGAEADGRGEVQAGSHYGLLARLWQSCNIL